MLASVMESPHVSFTVGKPPVRVFFPFEPYDTQREYVTKVIEALSGGHNAVLESPTGTGKTLSLLCSSLAWLNDDKGGVKKSMIYYTSRTHMQLDQAANEMKRTAYARNPAVVIGSRSKMCLNKDVKGVHGDKLINRACRNAIAKNACEYFANYEQKLGLMNHDAVHDIEDLLKFGTNHKCCPYYASKEIAESKASVVFMPYNYLLDTSMKKSVQLRLENSVIIIDEGHNLESALKESASAEFSLTCLDVIRESNLKLPEKLSEALNNEKHGLSRNGYDPQKRRVANKDEFSNKQDKKQNKEAKINPIEELAGKLTNDKLQQVNQCAEQLKHQIKTNLKVDESCTIDTVFDIMKSSGIQYSTSDIIYTTLESMASFWSMAGVMNPATIDRYVSAITSLSKFITLLFPENCLSVKRQQENQKKLHQFYGAHLRGIYDEANVVKQGKHKDSEFCLWCLHPGIGLKRVIDSSCINGPRSIIITSGTLAPTHSLPKEMDAEFKIIQEFDHVIKRDQMKMMIIGDSPKGYSLNSSYGCIFENSNFGKLALKEKYAIELGESLLPLLKVLPFGTLIFFPSYGLMNKVKKVWDKTNIAQKMNNISQIYIEDMQQDKFLAKLVAYKKIIDSKTGNTNRAAFLGVCRGKLSEGTNLEGNHCRTVILIGLPYPSTLDPKIVLTKKFYESREGNAEQGKYWYSEQMFRALNQTIGRVIRSKSDYGLVIFCDPRFKQTKYSLSKWVRDFFPRVETPWSNIDSTVKEFFQNHGVGITESASESCGAFEITFSSRTGQSGPGNLPAVSRSINNELPISSNPNRVSSETNITDLPSEQVHLRSASERQAALVSEYRVNRETYSKVQDRVRPHQEPIPAKKQKTTEEIFNSLIESTYNTKPSSNSTNSHQINGLISSSGRQPFACHARTRSSSNSVVQPSQTSSVGSNSTDIQSSNPISQSKSSASQDYSILNQYKSKDRPGDYKCSYCYNKATKPHRTNCKCARVGCLACLRQLIQRNNDCGKCGITLIEKKFKPLLFQSAAGKEKYPVKVVVSALKLTPK